MKPGNASLSIQVDQQGFGLIEQIVVLAILAVLTTIAAPSFHRMLEAHELRTAQADYIAALQHARNLAANEQRKIIFCPSRDARTCNGDGTWTGGWLIGYDNGKGELDGAPLYMGSRSIKRLDIHGSDSKKSLYFKLDGSTGNSYQTIYFCPHDISMHPLAVVISSQGRVRGEQADSDEAKCIASE